MTPGRGSPSVTDAEQDTQRHPYATHAYADSFRGHFTALDVPEWSTHVLRRPIPGTDRFDAIGPYPITAIRPEADIAAGIARLREVGIISIVLVADPLYRPEVARLEAGFDFCRPFKTHHLVVPDRPLAYSKGLSHVLKTTSQRCDVRFAAVRDCLAQWAVALKAFEKRHDFEGDPLAQDFTRMAETPGVFATIAETHDRDLLSVVWWIRQANLIHVHLAASTDLGYRLSSSYALYGAVIETFRECTINLGGCAGLSDDPNSGLWWFKQRFANAQATALICGSILDADTYSRLSEHRAQTAYFPAYRAPVR